MSRRRGRHPRRARGARIKGGWRRIESLLYEKHGVEFAEGERVVTALPVSGRHLERSPRRR
jgi:hypothetical protein